MNDCVLWGKALNRYGYGIRREGPKTYTAHRWSWSKNVGDIPEGMCVLHKCDQRSCVNPDHLFLGTTGDNTRDMFAKGRGPTGENHTSSKLTNEDIFFIRQSKSKGIHLAIQFGVTTGLISKIRLRQVWKHI
jgi:hypothetical protein